MAPRQLVFRYFDAVVVLFIATLLISNVGSTKVVGIGPVVFDGGTVLFPIAYIVGDILTEVYGFRQARRVIWFGFGALVLMSATLAAVQYLPAANGWDGQAAYERIAGFVPRLVGASIVAYLFGEFTNAVVLERMRRRFGEQRFWVRSIVSSLAGELLDTVIFSTIAFYGVIPGRQLIQLIVTVYLIKIGFELAVLPVTSRAVRILKRRETAF